jgi:hypothetical protein
MRVLDFSRHALTSCAAVAMLAGCGGSQPPIGASGTMPQTWANATHAERGKSWMLPEAKVEDLIYAVGGCGGTCVISYPALKYVGAIPTAGDGICSDTHGNVFVTNTTGVTEYAHAGTQPIATLTLPGGFISAGGCSVDPTTNNLAVVFRSSGADIAVFPNEQGTPTLYGSGIDSTDCGYDSKGNLYVDGYGANSTYVIAESDFGSNGFTAFRLPNDVGVPGQVQWDGTYVTYEGLDKPMISRLTFSGSDVTVVSTVTLKDIRHRQAISWIYGGNIVIPFIDRGSRPNIVGTWKYPKGGKIVKSIRKFDPFAKRTIFFEGVTVSAAPSRTRTH